MNDLELGRLTISARGEHDYCTLPPVLETVNLAELVKRIEQIEQQNSNLAERVKVLENGHYNL